MANKTKVIEIDLFRPYFMQKGSDGVLRECVYDLSALFKHIIKAPLTETKRRIYGDNHMFHVCKYNERKKLWEIQILHLREQLLPGIADEGGGYELIQLDNNQYPAESTTVIFAEDTNILYLQRNIYGTSIRALTALFQSISPDGVWVNLKPIMCTSKIDIVKNSKLYRKVTIAVDSEQINDEEKETALGKIISSFSDYQGKIVKFELGFGKKRKKYLNRSDTIQLLMDAYEFPGTEKLIATVSDSEDAKFEKVDLLDDREKILLNLSYSREEPITHERIFDESYSKI